MKKKLIIFSSFLILLTLSGCTTKPKEENTDLPPETSSEQIYPITLPPAPETFNAYYKDEKLDIVLSSKHSTEKRISNEIQENEINILLKANLPLTNLTTINMYGEVVATPHANDLADLYTEKILQFFTAGSEKDFSKITNYSNFFYQENQDEIMESSFIAEDMDKMSLEKIAAYDKILTTYYKDGQIYFTIAGYVDYSYAPDYLDEALLHDNKDIGLTFIYDPDKNIWLLNQLDWITIYSDLPSADQTDKFIVTTF